MLLLHNACLHTASGAESRPLVFGSLLVLSVATGKRVAHSDSSMFSSLFYPMLVLHLPSLSSQGSVDSGLQEAPNSSSLGVPSTTLTV